MARSAEATPEEDIGLRQAALAYVIALYRELTEENGAPMPGTQNQAVDFILADPERRRRIAGWAADAAVLEATTAPPRRLPQDTLYVELRTMMEGIMAPPVFETPAPPAG
ncbi:MAG: hypothetical protein AB7H90_13550 [Alphaproteobacteria bacterium]